MIMPFDLFGYELYQYTFRMKCEEISELELEDGATRIFSEQSWKTSRIRQSRVNRTFGVYGKINRYCGKKCESKRIHQMHERITKLKSSKEMEIKYMQKWEEKEIERQEAYAEGERVGEKRGRTEGETRINKLTKYLLEQERTEDLKKSSI